MRNKQLLEEQSNALRSVNIKNLFRCNNTLPSGYRDEIQYLQRIETQPPSEETKTSLSVELKLLLDDNEAHYLWGHDSKQILVLHN